MTTIPWLLASFAVAAALFRAWQVLGREVNHDALQAVLLRLLKDGDLARAKKLLAVASDAPVAAAMRAVMAQGEGTRPGTDAMVVGAALERAFADAFEIGVARIRASAFLSALAVVAAIASVGAAMQVGPPPITILVAAAAVLLVVGWATYGAHRIAVSGPRLFAATLPVLIEQLRGGTRVPSGESATIALAPSPSTSTRTPKKDVVFVDVARAGAETRHLELAQAVIKIGTHSAAHVAVEPEKGVGVMHAVIERTAEGAQIIDLGNQAGTVVGGAKVSRAKLHQGDEVVVGTTTLRIGLGLPPSFLELEAIDTDDPKTWEPAATFFYGFDTRSPDLFYELLDEIVRASPAAKGVRLAKLRRAAGAPAYVVALLGDEASVKVARAAVEQQIDARYARCATPAHEIAPDASYGPETSTSARLRAELHDGSAEVLVSVVV